MHSVFSRRFRKSIVGAAVPLVISALLSVPRSPLAAAEPAPVLAVPASESMLHLAVDFHGDADPKQGNRRQLVELGAQGAAVPAQLVPAIAADGAPGKGLRLLADIPPRAGAAGPRRFRVEPAGADVRKLEVGFQLTSIADKSAKLSEGDRPVFVYHYGTITDERVPPNDKRRSRACYIHPLWGLSGEPLTDDFPKDHYHHHGVFWAWPHVKIGGKEYDLWLYNNITPRFVRWMGWEPGPVAAVLGIENGWFVGDKMVMTERLWVRTYKAGRDQRAIDLDCTWIPVDQPITLRGAEGKSYGGLTVRFAVRNEKESVITVPSGRAKEDLPDTPLPWADLTSHFRGAQAEPSGAAIFVSPDHPDYPPTWLTRHYGAMCVGWPGVKEKTFPPGKPIRLSYRLWIHKAAVDVQELKQAYEAYRLGF